MLFYIALAASAILSAVLALALVREVRLRRALEALLRRILSTWRRFHGSTPTRPGRNVDGVVRCLKIQGGLDACHLAFYKQGDLGDDGVWDNWRLEGPSFVWYFRGLPHVHVWVHVADSENVKLNSYQNSIGV
jgi:hypothetical protein